MRKFNQTIRIEVQVDNIASQLLDSINPAFKHREPMVEAIIGTALNNKDTLSHIYNAMNGYLPEINFKVGDIVNCKATTYMYLTEESRLKGDSHRAELGKSVVVQIDPYRNDPLCVEYDYYTSNGTTCRDTRWVEMRDCSEFPSVSIQEDIFD
jgi:hypothetical protein